MKLKLTWLVRLITTSSSLWCWRCTEGLKVARRAQAGTRSYVHDRCAHVEEVLDPHDYTGSSPMTPEVCHSFCMGFESFYFGLRNGDSCWCGSMYNEYVGAGPGICDVPCAGDPHMRCGGKDATDVFIMAGPECGRQIKPPEDEEDETDDDSGRSDGTTTTTPSPGGGGGGKCSGMRPLGEDEVDLDFRDSIVKANNLGGDGPKSGAEEMRLGSIATVDGRDVDLVITAGDSYTRDGRNGLFGGLARIAMQAGSSAELTFKFVDAATGEEMSLPSFQLTILGIQQNRLGEAQKSVSANGFSEYFLKDETGLQVRAAPSGGQIFTSEDRDDSGKEPIDPLDLTPDQMQHSVTFLYKSKSKISMTFSVGESELAGAGFLIAGRSTISTCCNCKLSSAAGLCASEAPEEAVLDFKEAQVTANNLAGAGPSDVDPEEIRYRRIATTPDGTAVDLVITAESAYRGPSVSNGKYGDLGKIVVANSESVALRCRFEASLKVGRSVTVPEFYFSLLDMTEEKTVILSGFTEYWVTGSIDVKPLRGDSVSFTSSSKQSDETEQTVAVLFKDTAEFSLTLRSRKASGFLIGGKGAFCSAAKKLW
mmetsp:Transcript_11079/g.20146  ORF Transcript_11079/g.20146 Transcript_11079/m.20146 type:complete len:594 (+) Transcript_11079:79-1860(+)